jgi:hypothetical protein
LVGALLREVKQLESGEDKSVKKWLCDKQNEDIEQGIYRV